MTRSKGKASSPAPPKSRNSGFEGTPPVLDAMVDQVLAYSPPDSKAKPKVGKKRKPAG